MAARAHGGGNRKASGGMTCSKRRAGQEGGGLKMDEGGRRERWEGEEGGRGGGIGFDAAKYDMIGFEMRKGIEI